MEANSPSNMLSRTSCKQKILNLKHMKLLRLSLLVMGGWPNSKQDRHQSLFNSKIIYLIIQMVIVIGEINYLYQNFGVVDFFMVGDVYITTFLTILSLARLCLPYFKSYYVTWKELVTEFHLMYIIQKGNTFKEIFSLVDKVSHYYTIFLISCLFSGMLLFNLSPLYVNLRNGAFTTNRHNLHNVSLQFAVNYKYPGYDQRAHFLLTTIVNIYLSFLCSLSVISIDMLLTLMIFQILGHLEILSKKMHSMPKPKKMQSFKGITYNSTSGHEMEIFDVEENLQIKQKLKELVDHHNRIISFTDKISTLFGPMLGLNYAMHLVTGCLLLLECSRGEPDALVRFGPLTTMVLLQLIQTSVIFELLNSKSIALINSVYAIPWQCMSVANQRLVHIILCRVQRPIQVTALGLVGVGVQTMANVLKTTFSYYTFLRSL